MAGVLVIIGVFDLWPLFAGLGIVAAALTLAGQSIVLDYLMGILILVEGQYYVGDFVSLGGVEGTVEEIGFRRTTIRDTSGTVHSISNGEIRISSNFTRIYASAVVDIQGIRDEDVERAIDVMPRRRRGAGRGPGLVGAPAGAARPAHGLRLHRHRRHHPDVVPRRARGPLARRRRAAQAHRDGVHRGRHRAESPDGRLRPALTVRA